MKEESQITIKISISISMIKQERVVHVLQKMSQEIHKFGKLGSEGLASIRTNNEVVARG